MSPRAACRLATLGFERVHDYAAGKVEWLAHGLPVEGTEAARPTAGRLARRDVATCTLAATAAAALSAIAGSPYPFALVLSPDGVVLGRIRRSPLEGLAGDAPIDRLLEPGPSTIRPHLTVEELRRRLEGSDVRTLLVTRPDGTLVGVLPREAVPGGPRTA